jgi:CubicO group peptidase (beta-lactamase class C family)
MDNEVTSRLEETILGQMEGGALAGLAIALVRDGEIAWSKGYGTASSEGGSAITPDTRFSVQSVTKTITATAIMQLRDQGHFGLDDAANQHLAPVRIENEWEFERPVTIRHLLTHTAGLPVTNFGPNPNRLPLGDYIASLARCERPPGEAIIYANVGFDALGLLIERFSGETVGDYLQSHIFEPLEMRSSTLGNPREGTDHATGHYRSFIDREMRSVPLPFWPTETPAPSGAGWSTVEDLSRFLIAHLGGGAPILSAETAAEMHELHAPQGSSRSGQGLGFRATYANGRGLICHGGDGHGFTAFIGACPDDGLGVALLINTAGAQTARSIIANTALSKLAGDTPPRHLAPAPITPGLYRSTFWDIEVEARDEDPPTLTSTVGLVVMDDPTDSQLATTPDGRLEGVGGMFHGFEIEFDGADKPLITGGLYPFSFERIGDVPDLAAAIDEDAILAGAWSGTVRTPLGLMAVVLTIQSDSGATITTPIGGERDLEHLHVEKGRVEGDFSLSVPGLGEQELFVRLAAIGDRLVGKLYARGEIGEAAMQTELDRQ